MVCCIYRSSSFVALPLILQHYRKLLHLPSTCFCGLSVLAFIVYTVTPNVSSIQCLALGLLCIAIDLSRGDMLLCTFGTTVINITGQYTNKHIQGQHKVELSGM